MSYISHAAPQVQFVVTALDTAQETHATDGQIGTIFFDPIATFHKFALIKQEGYSSTPSLQETAMLGHL
ncbi:hypothetical protein ACJX0J_029815, partial [Zea mays]